MYLFLLYSIVFVLAVIGISLGIILPKQSNSPLSPEIKFYHYNEENVNFYESMDKYVEEKGIQVVFFSRFINGEENVKARIF